MNKSDSNAVKRRRYIWPWVVGTAIGLVLVWAVGACALAGITSGAYSLLLWREGAVGVIYVEGVIETSGSPTGSGVSSATILDFINQAEENRAVRAIVVFIDSPGGAVVPSAEIYRALREAKKPVVASMGDLAASGGYYIACGADKIVAHPATITGSIGVYGRMINAADLMKKLGVEAIIIRSGDAKAMGNLFEHPTEKHLAIEQAIVDEIYDSFVRAVAEGRGMDEDRVRQLADGRPYTGQQALNLGLIDELGSLQDAIRIAAEMGGITGEPRIIKYRYTSSILERLFQSRQMLTSSTLIMALPETRYLLPQAIYVGQ